MNASDKFLSGPASTGSESRPRAVNPETGREQSWQRASNYAAPLDNPHGLIKWQMRELVKGLSARPDLARMLLTGAVIEDNAKADEIIASAHAVAGIDAKANEGTAVHAALSRSFLGHEIPGEYMPHVRAFAETLQRNGLTPVATELQVLNVALGVIGHVDWIVRTSDGRHLVLDVKTGSLRDPRKFAVQCEAYGGSGYIDDGKGGWVPIPFTLDRSEAILAHVDPETGATSLYRVDLVLGHYGATLAERVRQWAKIDVLQPFTPVHPSVVGHVDFATDYRQQSANAADQADRTASVVAQVPRELVEGPAQLAIDAPMYGHRVEPSQPGSEVVPEATAAQHPELYQPNGVPIPAVPAPAAPNADTHPATFQPEAIATGQALRESVEAEKAALLKLDKAALQQKAKNEHGATDLAHNREWLACYIIARRRGMDESSSVMYAKSKGTMALGGAASFSQPIPTDDQLRSVPETGDLSFVFKAIEGAKSEGALLALRDNIVERRGDQAWTDEMAEAARQRVLQLIAASGNAVDPAARVLARIAQATEPAHIAALWHEVTIGGTAEANWTAQLKNAADARLHEIQASMPPPPANPYGPQ